ncbi:hypothetical protein [Paenibacillus turpanensis]|nr:hypothetical protein [Paenibacillus turpanensis]
MNKEVRDLNTHANGATNMHETRHTGKTVSIEQPEYPMAPMKEEKTKK